MTKDDAIFIRHMLDAIEDIESYVETKEGFVHQKIVQDAVIRKIMVIGEASKNISTSLRDKHPDIPWKDIVGMRDWLVHGYFGVDLDTVWKTIRDDIPSLKKQLGAILMELQI